MGLLEPTHLLLIGLAVLIFFGPKRIPEFMRGLGKGMGELQKGINEGKAALSSAMQDIQHEPVIPSDSPVPSTVAEPAHAPVAETVSKEAHVPTETAHHA